MLVLTTTVNQFHGVLTGGKRKAAKVPYPTAYASAAEAATDLAKHQFNCAQRAHANFLENMPNFVLASVVAGLRFPVATAVAGLVWNAGRIVFAKGYAGSKIEQKGDGRLKGVWYVIPQLALLGMAATTVYGLVF